MRRRYVLESVFDDADFDINATVDKFWLKSSAFGEWHMHENARKATTTGSWHFQVRDLTTNKVLTPGVDSADF